MRRRLIDRHGAITIRIHDAAPKLFPAGYVSALHHIVATLGTFRHQQHAQSAHGVGAARLVGTLLAQSQRRTTDPHPRLAPQPVFEYQSSG